MHSNPVMEGCQVDCRSCISADHCAIGQDGTNKTTMYACMHAGGPCTCKSRAQENYPFPLVCLLYAKAFRNSMKFNKKYSDI